MEQKNYNSTDLVGVKVNLAMQAAQEFIAAERANRAVGDGRFFTMMATAKHKVKTILKELKEDEKTAFYLRVGEISKNSIFAPTQTGSLAERVQRHKCPTAQDKQNMRAANKILDIKSEIESEMQENAQGNQPGDN